MLKNLRTWATTLLIAAALMGVNGCAAPTGPGGPGSDGVCAGGKCDSSDTEQRFVVDMERANEVWPGSIPAETPEDLMRVHVTLGPQTITADTHLFGVPVNVIPYGDNDNMRDAAGSLVARGDAVIAEYFAPGEFGVAVKHHRPQYRDLVLEGGSPDAMKEHFKLQDTHIEIVIGVADRDGAPGVITLNNPQTYPDSSNPGRFGDDHYSMIFLKPTFPEYLDASQISAYQDNMRTMAAGFNAVSDFPGDYNGGDPLAARNPEMIREHVAQMVRAIAGDASARAWFQEEEHMIYCAELAFVSMSSGMIVPLNEANLVPMVGADVWADFVVELEKHNAGEPSPFTELNGNPRARHVELAIAPSDLMPSATYAPAGSGADDMLAFQPMTMADIVQQFMATHMPRNELGEELAPLQGEALQAMQPGLLEAMKLDSVPLVESQAQIAAAPAAQQGPLTARFKVEELFNGFNGTDEPTVPNLVQVVSTNWGTYDEFRRQLAPLMAAARAMTGPRDDSGAGLFVPPSIMHVVAQGRHPAGLLGLRYVGHGLHYSMVRTVGGAPAPEPARSDCLSDAQCAAGETCAGGVCIAASEPTVSGDALLSESGMVTAGEEKRFSVTLPEGATGLLVEMTASGDPDLYVSKGSEPTESEYECRPYAGEDEAETCELSGVAGDVFHIMISGYSAASYELAASAL